MTNEKQLPDDLDTPVNKKDTSITGADGGFDEATAEGVKEEADSDDEDEG